MFLDPDKCGFCQGKLDNYDHGYQAEGCSRCWAEYSLPSGIRKISKYQSRGAYRRGDFIIQIGKYQIEYAANITYIAEMKIDKIGGYLIAPKVLYLNYIIPLDLTNENKCLERIKTLINFQ